MTSPGLGTQYPALYNVAHTPSAVVPASEEVEEEEAISFGVRAVNECCTLCTESLNPVSKPVALLPCGHAFHVGCARMFMNSGDCPERKCPGVVVAAAAATGTPAQQPSHDKIIEHFRSRTETRRRRDTDGDQDQADGHDEAFYRRQYSGLSKWQKTKLLTPYGLQVMRKYMKGKVTIDELLELEQQRAEGLAGKGDDENTPAVYGDAADVADRISVDRFLQCGLGLTDIFFGLDINSWDVLCRTGLSAVHLTNSEGKMPVTMLADLYNVSYEALVRDLQWNLDDVRDAKLSAGETKHIGLDFDKFVVELDLDRDDFIALRWSPKDWIGLGLGKEYLLEPLQLYAPDMRAMGWGLSRTATDFDLVPAEQVALGMLEDEVESHTKVSHHRRRRRREEKRVSSTSSSSSEETDSSDEATRGRSSSRTSRRRRTRAPAQRRSILDFPAELASAVLYVATPDVRSAPQQQQQQRRRTRSRIHRNPKEPGSKVFSLDTPTS